MKRRAEERKEREGDAKKKIPFTENRTVLETNVVVSFRHKDRWSENIADSSTGR